jgi:hypothetical protein
MRHQTPHNNSFDRTVKSLCAEIDFLRAELETMNEQVIKLRAENTKMINDNLAESQKGVAQALMFALSVEEDANGNLVIPSENRQYLADQYRTEEINDNP